jgi:hypothetical protein
MLLAAAKEATNLAFYEAAAQIIPVLFLALVVEERIFASRREDAPALELVILAAILVGIVGELVAINALITGERPGDVEQTTVVYAIVLLFLPFLGRAALPRFEALANASWWSAVLLQVLVVVVAFGIIGSTTFGYDVVPVAAGFAVTFFFIAVAVQNFESDLKGRTRRSDGDEDESTDQPAAAPTSEGGDVD